MPQKRGSADEANPKAKPTKPTKKLKSTDTTTGAGDVRAMGDCPNVSKTKQLRREAEDLVEEINVKRQNDMLLVADFKKLLLEQVEERVKDFEKSIMDAYQEKYQEMKDMFDDLFGTMDRTDKSEKELTQFHSALGMLCKTVKKSEYSPPSPQ